MPTRTQGHAIIGCGGVAPNHVDGFRSLDGWEVVWACDRTPGIAERFAAEHDIPGATLSVDEVLADPGVSSVSIVLDHGQHAGLTESALRAGKHVLVEKPLALSGREADSLVQRAKQEGLVLSVVSQQRYDPVVSAIKEWVDGGLLGDLLFCNASLESRREASYYKNSYWRGTWRGEGGSALINQGYHCLDVARSLLGELSLCAVEASRRAHSDVIETEDTLAALFVANGTPLTLTVTTASSTEWRSRVEVVGREGTVVFDLDHPVRLHRSTGNPALEERGEAVRRRSADAHRPRLDYFAVSHRPQIADFAAAVDTGSSLRVAPEEAAALAHLIESVYSQARPRLA